MVTEEQLESDYKSNKIANAKNMVKNTMDLSIQKPVIARVRQRMAELKSLSSSKHEKVQNGRHIRWYTTPPTMFINKLEAEVVNNIGTISYSIFESKNGKKMLDENIVEITDYDGKKKKVSASASYKIEKDVIETIEYRKPIKVEEFVNGTDA